MADIICFSGRRFDQIKSSFKHYSQCADNVFVARHPNADLLNISSNANLLVIQNPEVSFVRRIKQLLKVSSAKIVFLAADDDYLIKSNFDTIAHQLINNDTFSTVRIITLLASQFDKNDLDLSVYLNSPYVRSKVAERNLSNVISSHFYPLNLDFYTFYNREKYLFIMETIDTFLPDELFSFIDKSGKLLQNLIAYFQLLAGTVVDYSLPLYVRGTQTPVRKQQSFYDQQIVDKGQLLSFNHELKDFWNNKKALKGIIDSAMLIYEKYGYHSDFKLSATSDTRRKQIKYTLYECLKKSSDSIQNQMLSSYQDSYILRINSSPSLKKSSAHFENSQYIINSTIDSLQSPLLLQLFRHINVSLLNYLARAT